jgi:hypothetical protein
MPAGHGTDHALHQRGRGAKSGNPCPRFTAPVLRASSDMTVKMLVPIPGKEPSRRRGNSSRMQFGST